MSLFKISFFVLTMHAVLIFWGAYHVPALPLMKQTRLVTQTIAFNEPGAAKERITSSDKPSVPVEKKNLDLPVVKKKEKPVEKPKPKPSPKPVESEKKAEEPKRKVIKDPSLIAKAKENIAKITKTSDKTSTSEPIPSEQPKAKESDIAFLSSHEIDYRDELAGRLKLLLRLPEYGMVNVRLTVDRRGRVKKFEIVAAESDINKKYIESELPQLVFPAFGSNFGGETDHTFLISLNNEM